MNILQIFKKVEKSIKYDEARTARYGNNPAQTDRNEKCTTFSENTSYGIKNRLDNLN